MAYTVKQVAAMSGVSVRTLHFYDETGLLKPSYHGANRYRYCEEPELLTLQQILFYRELGFELKEIVRLPAPARISAGQSSASPIASATPHGRVYTWAELMKRVWALDVLECPRCHHRLRILAAIHPPDATRRILDCLGLPSRSPPLAPAVRENHIHPDWI